MKTKTVSRIVRNQSQAVLFEFIDPLATSVFIAGTFNEWHPDATPMIVVKDGRWAKQLVLPPGVYEYRFVVDGRWVSDPSAAETAPNPFGEVNSVVKVRRQQDEVSDQRVLPGSVRPRRSSTPARLWQPNKPETKMLLR